MRCDRRLNADDERCLLEILEQLVEWKLSNVLNVAMFHGGELLRSIEDNTGLRAFFE